MDSFTVIASGLFNEELKRLCSSAKSEGRLSLVTRTAMELMVSLQTDPSSIGEALYTLKHIGLPVRHVVRRP
jgi:hypothetical protein